MTEDPSDEFFEVVNFGLDARVVGEGENWLVAELMHGVFDVVTDGTTKTMTESMDFVRSQFPFGTKFYVWASTELQDGRYATTIAIEETKK